MHTFEFTRPSDVTGAATAAASANTAQKGAEIRFIAGGTTLIDLMKLNVEQPRTLIDLNRLPLAEVEVLSDGGLKIGRWSATLTWLIIRPFCRIIRCYRRLFFPAPPLNYETKPRPQGIYCSEPVACISGIRPCPATSGNQVQGVALFAGLIG